MRNKNNIFQITAGAAALLLLSGNAFAQSADALLDKLVEKGVLTVREAQELREETDKNFNQAYAVKSGMPEWVTTLKFGGDLRARYDGIYSDIPGIVDRHRARYRLRFGAIASLTDNLEVGLRLVSSTSTGGNDGGDPVSTNETLGNNGNRKPIGLDWVYARWTPINSPEWTSTFTFGKFDLPFVFSEMLFDGDYTPEGFAEQIRYRFNDEHTFNLNLGQFFLDEISASSADPFMFGAQARLESMWNEKWQSSFGIAGLTIVNPESLKTAAVPDIGAGNTRTPAPDSALVHDYNVLVLDGAITYNLDHFPRYQGPFPIKFGAEYIHNFGAPAKNVAYGIGPTFGKAGKRGTWEFSLKYKELPADAFYEETVDSDYGAFYSSNPPYDPAKGYPGYRSGTNVRGPVFRFSYSPYDSLTFSVMYALTELIDEVPAGSKSDGSRLIADAVFKF